jgi:hypothetical protein
MIAGRKPVEVTPVRITDEGQRLSQGGLWDG